MECQIAGTGTATSRRKLMTTSSTTPGRSRTLADGNEIPVLALGVWQVPDGPACHRSVEWALEAGYRHIDTAQGYGNESSVGQAIRSSGIPREDIFITTKFNPSSKDPEAEIQRSLERLQLDSVDLYIVHWPKGGPTWAWDGMQRSQRNGYARSIGVSNFSADELDAVLKVAEIPPVINQVQFSPFEFRRSLLEKSEAQNIVLEAYSPLGTGSHLDDPTIAGIAERLGRTPAQVLIRWAIQHGLVVLPKSTHQERIQENAQVFDFELSPDDMTTLDSLDSTGGTDDAREAKWW